MSEIYNWFVVIIIAILLILLGVYLVKNRVIYFMTIGLKVLFFTLLITALLGLLFQPLFSFFANQTLISFGTLETIQKIDNATSVDNVVQPAKDVFNSIVDFFGGTSTQKVSEPSIVKQGLLEKELYPGLVSTVEVIYRVITVIVSIAGMVGIIYLSYSTSSIAQVEELKIRINKLEQQSLLYDKENK